jgi:hypothetical protein
MQPHPVHEAVCYVCRPGHVTDLFKEPQSKKEDHEDRQEEDLPAPATIVKRALGHQGWERTPSLLRHGGSRYH